LNKSESLRVSVGHRSNVRYAGLDAITSYKISGEEVFFLPRAETTHYGAFS
jgi:hypothetical protein